MLLSVPRNGSEADGRLPDACCCLRAAAGGKPAEWRLCCTDSRRRATCLINI